MSPSGAEAPAGLEDLLRRTFGVGPAEVAAIDPGLGTRRFFRVRLASGDRGDRPESVIARVDAPEDPARRPTGVAPEPPLEPIRAFLERSGIPVPRRHAEDADRGIQLLEDVGDRSLERAVAEVDPATRRALYAEVIGWIPRIQALEAPTPPIAAFERRLDATQLAYKASRLIEYGLPGLRSRATTRAEAEVVRRGFDVIAEWIRAAPARLAHRDLKAANVHWRKGGGAVLIDLQGAFLAPPEYDLVCLLHDAHVDLSMTEIDEHLAVVRPSLPDAPAPDEFAARFHALTLSRVGKDVSLYLYAASDLGDRRYLPFVPRAVRILRTSASRAARAEPRLAALADLLLAIEEPTCGR